MSRNPIKKPLADRFRPEKNQLTTPLVIGGIGRSGTTILLRAVAKHKHVYDPPTGEGAFFQRFFNFLYKAEENMPARDWMMRNYRVGEENRGFFMLRMIRDMQSPDIRNANTRGLRYWPIKGSLPLAPIRKLYELDPKARYIHIYRNGISVVHSASKFHGFEERSFEEQCERWKLGMERMEEIMNQKDIVITKYEDLDADPHKEFKRIFKEAGLEHDDNPAHFFAGTHIFSSYSNEDQKKRPSVEERWNSWTKKQQQMFKKICGPKMKDLGYDIPKGK